MYSLVIIEKLYKKLYFFTFKIIKVIMFQIKIIKYYL